MEKMGWNDKFMDIKLGSKVSRECDVMRFLYALAKGNIQETNKIIDWINKHEKIIRETEQLAENLAMDVIEQKRKAQDEKHSQER